VLNYKSKNAKQNKKIISNNYFWLSVEGTDCTGKTSLIEALNQNLSKELKSRNNFITVQEFSNSRTGFLIKNIIKKNNFFSLGSNFPHRFAETLLLGTDFVYQFEDILQKNRNKNNLFIISDRGPYSFLTYQFLRIKEQHQIFSNLYLEKWIENIFQPIGFPHFVILLTSPSNQIKRRIIERDVSLKKDAFNFIKQTQEKYLKILKDNNNQAHLILENKDEDFDYIVRETVKQIKRLLGNTRDIVQS